MSLLSPSWTGMAVEGPVPQGESLCHPHLEWHKDGYCSRWSILKMHPLNIILKFRAENRSSHPYLATHSLSDAVCRIVAWQQIQVFQICNFSHQNRSATVKVYINSYIFSPDCCGRDLNCLVMVFWPWQPTLTRTVKQQQTRGVHPVLFIVKYREGSV